MIDTTVWTPAEHQTIPPSEIKSEKPLVNLSTSIPSPLVHFSGHECVWASPVQTHIEIRLVDLLFLHARWSHLHILERCISFLPDHSGVSGSWWIFDVGGWRRESFLSKLMVLWITGYVLFLTLCHAYIVKYLQNGSDTNIVHGYKSKTIVTTLITPSSSAKFFKYCSNLSEIIFIPTLFLSYWGNGSCVFGHLHLDNFWSYNRLPQYYHLITFHSYPFSDSRVIQDYW